MDNNPSRSGSLFFNLASSAFLENPLLHFLSDGVELSSLAFRYVINFDFGSTNYCETDSSTENSFFEADIFQVTPDVIFKADTAKDFWFVEYKSTIGENGSIWFDVHDRLILDRDVQQLFIPSQNL